jgi:hypothetical protein
MTKDHSQPTPGDAHAPSDSEKPADPEKAESGGVRSRLTEAQKAMLDSKSRGGGAGLQSVGKSHKPTHVSGKQGPAEKKVRW